jgi:hypothetical protein
MYAGHFAAGLALKAKEPDALATPSRSGGDPGQY